MSKKINEFNPKNLTALRARINEALADVTAEFGVVLDLGKITYGDNTASAKFNMTAIGEGVTGNAKETKALARKAEFIEYAYRFGFEESDFGRKFKLNGQEFVITGLDKKARKNGILGKSTDPRKDTEYKFPSQPVLSQLRKEDALA